MHPSDHIGQPFNSKVEYGPTLRDKIHIITFNVISVGYVMNEVYRPAGGGNSRATIDSALRETYHG